MNLKTYIKHLQRLVNKRPELANFTVIEQAQDNCEDPIARNHAVISLASPEIPFDSNGEIDSDRFRILEQEKQLFRLSVISGEKAYLCE